MAGPVLEALGPAGRGDDVPADLVDVAGRHPGRHRGHPGRLGLGHHVEHRGQLAGRRPAHAEGPGHVRAVAVEGGAEVDHHRVARRGCAGRPGRAWGLAEFSPDGHDGLEGPVLGAAARAWRGRARRRTPPRSASRRRPAPWPAGAAPRPRAASAMAAARVHAGDLAGVLDHPQALDHAPGWRPAVRGASTSSQVRTAGPGDVGGLEAEHGGGPGRSLGQRLALGGHAADARAPRRRPRRPRPAARPPGSGSGRRWSAGPVAASPASTPAEPVNPVSQRTLAGVVTTRASGRPSSVPAAARAARSRSRRPVTDSGGSGAARSSTTASAPRHGRPARRRATASTASG